MAELTIVERLRLFDEATLRQREREKTLPQPAALDRSWTREELYLRGGAADARNLTEPIAES